ncbi:hypothetical protein GLAREA_11859 [Glarea lozoyensis ATCC 20868]|uniref:Uncharacterized protein n=1 Tax=Glarea lozoyensis (strain ATCC 20868 / MF5171) TaxID=1116229 RepID=S3CZV0_GLAL2|nr:uncharacterized protein GLAREA_11859 [Glarea lozoyensis ATCC 20868]EPE31777.1 hypothetical protein GLAREA_11859 [Glarea lozoyensis ATCC 20868]
MPKRKKFTERCDTCDFSMDLEEKNMDDAAHAYNTMKLITEDPHMISLIVGES